MKTKTITLYEYSELSQEVQQTALKNWNEHCYDPLMQSHMINVLKEKLETMGIKYDTDSIDVRYSLSYSQGDGFMFIGKLEWKQYTIYIKHNNGHYYHSNTANIEMQESDNLGFHMDEDHEDVKQFNIIYRAICKEMERVGYEEIEYNQSEESFINYCEANNFTFRENGIMEE